MKAAPFALNVRMLEAVTLWYGCEMGTPGQKKLAELRTPAVRSLSVPITQQLLIVVDR